MQILESGQAVSGLEIQIELSDSRRVIHPWLRVSAQPIKLSDQPHMVVVIDDITAKKNLEQELLLAATTDKLTGLPNRTIFAQRLEHMIQQARGGHQQHFAVLYMDFDRFKTINDSMGHTIGDQLLMLISDRLRQSLQELYPQVGTLGDHRLARLGGDEFAVQLDQLKEPAQSLELAEQLLLKFSEPFQLDDRQVYCSASIGIVTSAIDPANAQDILRDGDTAMYQAKLAGGGRAVVFDVNMRQQVQRRMSLEHELRTALENHELRLFYQPIVCLRSGVVRSYEALLRWTHPQHGPISPAEFIPVAEDTGLIVPLGEWVLREACIQWATWHRQSPKQSLPSLSVNLSRIQIMQSLLPQQIHAILEETGLPPDRLHLEVTESAVMKDLHTALHNLRQIRELGVKLSMDDFGTGYSTLAGLQQFPIDTLKIDRAFITHITQGRGYAALVHAVTELAGNLGISVVAEGIETIDQLLMLQSIDCGYGQGYLFSKPIPADMVPTYRVPVNLLPGMAA
ncbi:MAG: EAL domain-containing protein [Phycisphaerales bacterium]|nr:EAL domain-containing protein [Phycisphaerales bacterium]